MSAADPAPPPAPGTVDRPEDITPEWLSAALSVDGDTVEVTEVAAHRFGTGQMGTAVRLRVRYAPGSEGPERLVAKLGADDPAARAIVAEGYKKEVGFYAHVASTVSVRTPHCHYVAINDDGSSFTLLLDDLSPARPGVQLDGCSLAEAEAAVRNVAGLHAPRWDDPTLEELDFLQRVEADVADFMGSLLVDATEQFLGRYVGVISDEDATTLREAARATGGWLVPSPGPLTIIHGDYRLDNLLFHPGGEVHAVDWQTASLSPPLRDVSYFLQMSLDVEMRRAHEEELVGAYHRELVRHGVEGYDAEACFEDYRLGQLHGPLITVMGSEYAPVERTPEADRMFLSMAQRSLAAIRDLGTLDLVDRA